MAKICTEILRHFLFTLLQTRFLSDFLFDFEGSNLGRGLNWRTILQFLTRSTATRTSRFALDLTKFFTFFHTIGHLLLLHLIWRNSLLLASHTIDGGPVTSFFSTWFDEIHRFYSFSHDWFDEILPKNGQSSELTKRLILIIVIFISWKIWQFLGL